MQEIAQLLVVLVQCYIRDLLPSASAEPRMTCRPWRSGSSVGATKTLGMFRTVRISSMCGVRNTHWFGKETDGGYGTNTLFSCVP